MAKKKRGKKADLGKLKGFSIQFLPYSEIKDLNSDERIHKILNIVLGNKILVVQGRLTPEEETRLIGDTMAMVDHVKNFKGVELAVIGDENDSGLFGRFKKRLANILSGGDLRAITIVGPATIVKEIKKDPKQIELMLNK